MPNGILLAQSKSQPQHDDMMKTLKATPMQPQPAAASPVGRAQMKTKTASTDGYSAFANSINNNNNKSAGTSSSSSNSSTTTTTNTGPGTTTSKAENILNVAEMLLHGVADNEILDIWLKSIACQEFVGNFIDAGYDMPTISRITPQDLTAIGITDPTKRLKILSEIKKLNLQDGIPNFRPPNLSHWLSLVRLDSFYYKSLCDQQIDTIEKVCQLTWEDFEELGISKLGHQKRLQLAIEKIKELEANERNADKRLTEPIYDTNPSQILLVASSENHTTSGPVINKQSSTSELSSTGSGSMHSVYSANSSHYQPTYASIQPQQQQQMDKAATQQRQQQQQQQNQNIITNHQMQHKSQPIYSQPPAQLLLQQHQHQQPLYSDHPTHITATTSTTTLPEIGQQQQSHYQAVNQHQLQQMPASLSQAKFSTNITDNGLIGSRNTMVPHMNRQSLGQLPSIALANLPKHQQQLLQQSSIYATLSRQPQRVKQPPPPVPIRTNSLKSNSSVDDVSGLNSNTNSNQQQPSSQLHNYYTQQLNNFHTSTSSLFRSGTRVSNRNGGGAQTMLTKNKSFSGNAHMEALRARFLNRNSQHQFTNLPHQIQSVIDQPQIRTNTLNNLQNLTNNNNNRLMADPIYGIVTNGLGGRYHGAEEFVNGHMGAMSQDGDSLSLHSRQSAASMTNALQQATNSLYNEYRFSSNSQSSNKLMQQQQSHHNQQPVTKSQITCPPAGANLLSRQQHQQQHQQQQQQNQNTLPSPGDNPNHNFDLHSDTNSTRSLILPSSASTINSALDSNSRTSDSPGRDSGSSQTLYNSASSGSGSSSANDQNGCYSQPGSGGLTSHHSTTSSSTLNDVNLTLDQQQQPNLRHHSSAVQQQHQPAHPGQQNRPNHSQGLLSPTALSSSFNIGSDADNRADATALNATTGKDDDFPPPPSPLSLNDPDEHDQLGSAGGAGATSSDGQFAAGITHGLMTFRVGS